MSTVLYCGDTSANAAAAYLLGVLNHIGIDVTYVASSQKLKLTNKRPKLLILSDYPAKNISAAQQIIILEWIESGMAFWMIGGWESFYGLNGEYTGKWAELLPVIIQDKDDRVNSFIPYVMNPVQKKHPIIKGLPWQQGPSVGGFNQVKVKKSSRVLIEGILFQITNQNGKLKGKQGKSKPLLVEGKYGAGKTLALMTDLAPHWIGGFVDWGNKRIASQGKNAEGVETGDLYVKFIRQIVDYLIK